ncbi:hypothetical protein V8E51_017888 [Hyaloscypha variabilis]|jgi:hypothetical protein
MLFGIFFAFWRFMEIITLIPTLGMLAYFVHIYASNNALTPTYILVLFIVSVLGAAWAIATLFTYHRSRDNARFVAFIDLCFVGALIAGVYELRGITHENCASVQAGQAYQINFGILGSATFNGLHFTANKQCSMLKASFAFGIMNVIFFFITSMLALFHGSSKDTRKETYVRETHYSRHGHRRSGSHRSHRSSHSGTRRHAYV